MAFTSIQRHRICRFAFEGCHWHPEFVGRRPHAIRTPGKGAAHLAVMMQNAYLKEDRQLITAVIQRFKRQAHRDIPAFQLLMARIYREGLSGVADTEKALYWFKKAAKHKNNAFGRRAAREMQAM